MELEREFVEFILEGSFEKLSSATVGIVKNVVLTNLGAVIGGCIMPKNLCLRKMLIN